jgi:hypothetical protein
MCRLWRVIAKLIGEFGELQEEMEEGVFGLQELNTVGAT